MNEFESMRAKLEAIYKEGGDYRVNLLKMGGRYGFYLFERDSTEGHLLCTDETFSVFYQLELSSIDDKEPFYDIIRNVDAQFPETIEDKVYTISFTRGDIRRQAARHGFRPDDEQCDKIAQYMKEDMFDPFEHYAFCDMLGDEI